MNTFLENILFILFIASPFIIYGIYQYINFKKYINSNYYKETNNSYSSILSNVGLQGEFNISKHLKDFELLGCKTLYNLYIPKKNGRTSEVDILLISQYGLLVIESKNYSGWIFGKEHYKFWTQTLPSGYYDVHKERFYNPIMQNNSHINALKNFLEINIPFYSIIVFSNHCEFKDVQVVSQNIKVIHNRQLKQTIYKIMDFPNKPQLTNEQIDEIYQKLFPYTQVDSITKNIHAKNIKKNI